MDVTNPGSVPIVSYFVNSPISSPSLPNHYFQITPEHFSQYANYFMPGAEYAYFPSNFTPQYTMLSSQLPMVPSTTNFEINSSLNLQSTVNSTLNSNNLCTISLEQTQVISKTVKPTSINSVSFKEKNYAAEKVRHQTSLKDRHFKKKRRNLKNRSKFKYANTAIVHPQVSAPKVASVRNPKFPTLPAVSTSCPVIPKLSTVSLPKHDFQCHSQPSTYDSVPPENPNKDLKKLSSTNHFSSTVHPKVSAAKVGSVSHSNFPTLPVVSTSCRIIPKNTPPCVSLPKHDFQCHSQPSTSYSVPPKNPNMDFKKLSSTNHSSSRIHFKVSASKVASVGNPKFPTLPVVSTSSLVIPKVSTVSLNKHDFQFRSQPSTYSVPPQNTNKDFEKLSSANHSLSTVHPKVSAPKVASVRNPKFPTLPVVSTSCPVIPTISTVSLSKHVFNRPSQPSTSYSVPPQNPNKDSEKLPSANHCSSMPHDPQLLAKKNNVFAERRGEKDLLLYHKIGKEDVTKDFETLILQWNPSWVTTQKSFGRSPPICRSFRIVTCQYPDEMAYYNTYVPLHLLHIWFNIYERVVKKKGIYINCIVQQVEKSNDLFKICCTTELKVNSVGPIRDDIVYCMHNNEEAFLRVQEVKMKLEAQKKLKISMETLHDLNIKSGDKICFSILINIRTACLKTEALRLLDTNIKDVVLKPELYASCIEIAQIDKSRPLAEQINDIMLVFRLDPIRMIAIKTFHMCDIIMIVVLLCICILEDKRKLILKKDSTQEQTKVLIILKNDEILFKLFQLLYSYNPILAIRSKQIKLSAQCMQCTLESRLEKKEKLSEILCKHNVFLSTFSAFGSAEKASLSKIKSLTCIIDAANSCTEVETALPLTLKINKLLLVENQESKLILPQKLKTLKYDVTLFARLLKAKLHS